MSRVEVKVPDMGGAADAEVIELLVKPGDEVAAEDSLIVVESDKATVEIPSPRAGRVAEFQIRVGDRISEGTPILWLEAGEPDAALQTKTQSEPEPPVKEKPVSPPATTTGTESLGGAGGSETLEVPDIGGSDDVSVIELCVGPGDRVSVDDPLIVLESDKATMEVPSTREGVVRELLVKEGDKVRQGTPMLVLEVSADSDHRGDRESVLEEVPARPTPPPTAAPTGTGEQAEAQAVSARVHAGPSVRRMARELGVDLDGVKGSGPSGRILKEDLQAHIRSSMQQLAGGVATDSGAGLPRVRLPDFSQFGEVERDAMSRVHQLTAENMQRSWLNVPHVTQFDEADITDLENFRKSQKASADKRGLKLTPLPFLIKACAYALQAYPQFNVSLDMDNREIIRKRYIHIGIAVDTPNGLVVPVIRDVPAKGIWELARECAELAEKARERKLAPAEMQGGCFSISSLGSVGGTAFTPIVNTPEVAILGVSRSQFKPVYDGQGGFAPRLMLPLSLSYDHRAVNGADAARFTRLLSELLGDLRRLLL